MLFWVILIAIIWIAGGFVAYSKFIKDWNVSVFEKIYFSSLWPATLLVYILWWIRM